MARFAPPKTRIQSPPKFVCDYSKFNKNVLKVKDLPKTPRPLEHQTPNHWLHNEMVNHVNRQYAQISQRASPRPTTPQANCFHSDRLAKHFTTDTGRKSQFD